MAVKFEINPDYEQATQSDASTLNHFASQLFHAYVAQNLSTGTILQENTPHYQTQQYLERHFPEIVQSLFAPPDVSEDIPTMTPWIISEVRLKGENSNGRRQIRCPDGVGINQYGQPIVIEVGIKHKTSDVTSQAQLLHSLLPSIQPIPVTVCYQKTPEGLTLDFRVHK
jgi:hypothetical protein